MIPISFTRPPLWFSFVVTTIVAVVAGFLIWIAVQDTEPIPVPTDMTVPSWELEGGLSGQRRG